MKSVLLISLLIIPISSSRAADPLPLSAYFSASFKKVHTRPIKNWDAEWQLVEQLYTELRNHKTIPTTLRIPKKIHQIWLGSPVPERYARLQKTFRDNHPDWEYIVWTDADIEKLNLENATAYNASTNYGEKSDIARYEILYRFGGLYADFDVECLHSFDELHHLCDFYAGLSPLSDTVLLENCIIGCAPGHPIMKHCITSLVKQESSGYLVDITKGTGPGHLTKSFFATIGDAQQAHLISVALPSLFFFSPDLFSGRQIKYMPFLAIHYWEGSWQEPEHRWHNKGWKDYGTRFR